MATQAERTLIGVDHESISDRTVPGVFFRQAARYGDRVSVRHFVNDGWADVSWAEMQSRSLAVAAALVGAGVKPRDHVILWSPNRVEWLFCDLGIQSAGAITVPVYPSTLGPVAERIALDCKAVAALVTDPKLAGQLSSGRALKRVALIDDDVAAWVQQEPSAESLAEIGRRLEQLKPDDVSTLMYTSGTTGEPKGVMLAHRNIIDMTRNALAVHSISAEDVGLSFLPLAHSFERVDGAAVAAEAGCTSYLARGMDNLLEDLAAARPTIMCGVPRMYEKMHERVYDQVRTTTGARRSLFDWAIGVGRRHLSAARPGLWLGIQRAIADRLVLSRLRNLLTGGRLRFFVTGGAPLNIEVEEFFWALGVKILQGWGLTETTAGVTSNTEAQHRFGSVGRPLPGVELKIAADGEILVRGDGVMLGYYNRPDANAEVFEDGWFKTGDIGELDAEGFLTITDRKKDLIKTAGGKYVAPQPIEARLQEDRSIERAVVIGDGRPYCVALIVPEWESVRERLGLKADPEDLLHEPRVRDLVQRRVDEVNRDLGGWEQVKYFELLAHDFSEAAGEITPTLKVKRRVVAERCKDVVASMYQGKRKPPRPVH